MRSPATPPITVRRHQQPSRCTTRRPPSARSATPSRRGSTPPPTRGGKIVSFGTSQSGASSGSQTDHALYLDNSGRINLGSRQGVEPGGDQRRAGSTTGSGTTRSACVTNAGMNLYIDGVRVARRARRQDRDVPRRLVARRWRHPQRLAQPPHQRLLRRLHRRGRRLPPRVDGSARSPTTTPRPEDSLVNQAPRASFTTQQNQLVVDTDAVGSRDPDGSITSYDWSWGDGQPNGSGVAASHTYARAGTHKVTLTVTDDGGATESASQMVDVGESAQPLADDTFERTLTGTWGSADLGGPWTGTGALRRFSVADGQGRITASAPGQGSWAYLNDVNSADVSGTRRPLDEQGRHRRRHVLLGRGSATPRRRTTSSTSRSRPNAGCASSSRVGSTAPRRGWERRTWCRG